MANETPPHDHLKVGVEQADVRDGLQDWRDIETAAPPMPMSLIEPLSCEPADAQELLRQSRQAGIAWGLRAMGVDLSKFDGAGVSVAVIDTGIKRSHAAFAHIPQDAILEADFTGKPNGVHGFGTAEDSRGHGTHCAATICGGVVDGVRIGVAPKIDRLLIAKAIGGDRGSAALLEALSWAVAERVDVISMSLGFDFVGYRGTLIGKGVHDKTATSMALTAFRDNIRVFDAWMEELRSRRKQRYDPLVIAASGNESGRPTYVVEKASPSEAESVIAVGAIDETFAVAPFSNIHPSFVGPGVNVLSAGIHEELAVMSGTSMACPHIAGLAALYWQAARLSGAATSARVLRMMENSADENFGPFQSHVQADVGMGMPRAPEGLKTSVQSRSAG
ncbi:S8 family serine peptidase [Bradyrhizobium vignae]|uniref:S8 family serine peptidase n=1 Tax=Bradyrhizobium vignae TaxID=1549949 RepID=UPI001356D47D|nr:S8 family serine peptidase [Bradyrhizobium vignae]